MAGCVRRVEELGCLGPLTSDTHIHDCEAMAAAVESQLDAADDTLARASRAGAYYGYAGASESVGQSAAAVRQSLALELARLGREDAAFRSRLTALSRFVALDDPEAFAAAQSHANVRSFQRYLSAVVLQVCATSKIRHLLCRSQVCVPQAGVGGDRHTACWR